MLVAAVLLAACGGSGNGQATDPPGNGGTGSDGDADPDPDGDGDGDADDPFADVRLDEPFTLRLSTGQEESNLSSSIRIARDLGFYEELNLELDWTHLNPPTGAQALLAGELDIAQTGSGTFSAILQGASLKVIFAFAQQAPYLLIGQPEITDWSDLHGAVIGVASTTGTQVLDLSMLLRMNGVDPATDGVQFVAAGAPIEPNVMAALRNGAYDAGIVSNFGIVAAKDEGFSVISDFDGLNTMDYALGTTEGFLEERPDVVDAFVLGTLMGLRVYLDHPEIALPIVTEQLGGNDYVAEELMNHSKTFFLTGGLPTEEGLEEAVQYKRDAADTIAADRPAAEMFERGPAERAGRLLDEADWTPEG